MILDKKRFKFLSRGIKNYNNEIPPAGLEPATFGSTVQRSAN